MLQVTVSAALFFQPGQGASVPLAWLERGVDFLVESGFPPQEMALSSMDGSVDGLFAYPSQKDVITSKISQGVINVLGIYANPAKGQDLVMNWQALVYIDPKNGYAFLGVPKELGYSAADLLRKALAVHEGFVDPHYGFAYFHPTRRGPDFFAVGILAQSDGYEMVDDVYGTAVAKWFAELSEGRRHFRGWFRDVFPANLLSEAHVNVQLQNGQTLRDAGLGRLTPLESGLWLWELLGSEMAAAREALAKAGVLICI
ncbi:MAG: hypothetical protein HYS12_29685 [Planctomycetes bacterium]|nr:hypothetical protein [Planctomycetota bacterium]